MAKFITNQNIELTLELASLGDRIIATILDSLIAGAYSVVVFILFVIISDHSNDEYTAIVFLILLLIPVFFYHLIFEIYSQGQSPGKKARDIKVVRLNGGAPTLGNYILRWLLRPVDMMMNGGVAIICVIASKNAQRLGDIVAGTTVVKIRENIMLDDVKTLNVEINHEVTFPVVRRLSDAQVDLIRKALEIHKSGQDSEGVASLSDKIKETLNIESEMPPVKFLYTIVKDYEYLMNQ